MGIDEILEGHREAIREAARRFGVESVFIFGSVARGDARHDSDVDTLVEYARPVGLFDLVRFKRALEEILGRKVDMTTDDALKPALRERIHREAVLAAYGVVASNRRYPRCRGCDPRVCQGNKL